MQVSSLLFLFTNIFIKKKLLPKDVYIQTFLCSKHFCIKLKYAGLVVAAAVLRSLRRRRLLQANSSMNFFKTFFISQKLFLYSSIYLKDYLKGYEELLDSTLDILRNL